MKLAPICLAVALMISGSPTANASGYGSNLGMMGYPSPTCFEPFGIPSEPYSTDRWAIQSYNAEVSAYNAKVDLYNECRQTYVQNAKNDAQEIVDSVKAIGDRYVPTRFTHGTNLGFGGYPSAEDKCTSYSYPDDSYKNCLLEYIENARNDIEKIKQKVRTL